jgi:hypothetical protein
MKSSKGPAVAGAILVLFVSGEGVADSIRESVSNHVSSELSRSEGSSSSSGSEDEDEDQGRPGEASVARGPEPRLWPWEGVQRRGMTVAGRAARFDVGVELRMRTWIPAQNPSVQIAAQAYRTASLELRGEIEGLVSLRRLVLETGSRGSFLDEVSLGSPFRAGPGGVARAVAMVGLPLLLGGRWPFVEPMVLAESSAFATSAAPSRAVCVVARGADTSLDPPPCAPAAGPLEMVSTFRSLVLGAAFGGADPPFSGHLGLDLVAMRKPYQVDVGGQTLEEFLFDARFTGIGAALGLRLGLPDEGPTMALGLRVGDAKVSLTDDLELGEVLPPGWDLEYLRWDVDLGYGLVLRRGPPAVVLRLGVEASGAHFFYSQEEGGQNRALSEDVFLTGRVALVVML